MQCTIKAFPVRCGDCLLICFGDDESGKPQRILVDTGYANTYHRTLKPVISDLIQHRQQVDLVVLTHVDGDHIGGIKPLLNDYGVSWFKQAWFNYAPVPYSIEESDEISIKQGILLRDWLINAKKVIKEPIVTGYEYPLGMALLTVLSPDTNQFDRLIDEWRKEELYPDEVNTISTVGTDYDQPISALAEKDYISDMSWSNRSSIAFILQIGTTKAFFTGDAHPDVLVASLEAQGYSDANPIRLQFMKVAHHGSKSNTNDELTRYVDCQHYLISSNADNKHQFPHKESLARIIWSTHNRRPDEPIHLYFTYDDAKLRDLFTQEEMTRFRLACHYPDTDTGGITISYPVHEYP